MSTAVVSHAGVITGCAQWGLGLHASGRVAALKTPTNQGGRQMDSQPDRQTDRATDTQADPHTNR